MDEKCAFLHLCGQAPHCHTGNSLEVENRPEVIIFIGLFQEPQGYRLTLHIRGVRCRKMLPVLVRNGNSTSIVYEDAQVGPITGAKSKNKHREDGTEIQSSAEFHFFFFSRRDPLSGFPLEAHVCEQTPVRPKSRRDAS